MQTGVYITREFVHDGIPVPVEAIIVDAEKHVVTFSKMLPPPAVGIAMIAQGASVKSVMLDFCLN